MEDDGDVGSVEELDRIAALLTTITSRFNGKVNTESLNNKLMLSCVRYVIVRMFKALEQVVYHLKLLTSSIVHHAKQVASGNQTPYNFQLRVAHVFPKITI